MRLLLDELKPFQEFVNQFGFDLYDFKSTEDLKDKIYAMISEQDIVYYHKAMKYLSENDPSLMISLGIATELGFNTSNLNSEKLATILLQRYLEEEFNELLNKYEYELNELFENK